ncbi:MAG: BREX-1 system phosphatase PglZ type A [Methanobacteriaceae archaeon]|nr:BREX-1 system phosphatase PglZ type A [Methanobacteriaceae archaeon]
MKKNHIQEKLNQLFHGESRLVFWYDNKAEFCDEINDLELENAKIYHLTQDNWLYTKYFLEVKDTKNNYLIYAPFPKPEDKDNYLADMAYYATPFCADKISLISQELDISDQFKSILKKYEKFWNANSRVNSFKDLNIENYSDENITIAILCVLAKVKIVSFDELLKKVLMEDDINENKFLIEFEKMDILDAFWDLSKEKFGYEDKNPTIQKFLISLIITYTSTQFKGNIPTAWKKLLSKKKNSIAVFINNLMNNTNYKDKYDEIVLLIAQKMKIEGHLKRIPVENYFDCDTFEIFDKNIIDHLIDLLTSNREEVPFIHELLAERKKTHFYTKYEHHYAVIKWANCLIKQINEFSDEPYINDIEDIISKYCHSWSFIDRSYRKFYYHYDKISNQDQLHILRRIIENMYTKTYLSELAMKWSDKLEECGSIQNLPIDKQYNFYKDNVVHSVKKAKTAVIISDAFRYEIAEELKDKLDKDPTRKTKIKPMVSSIPSYTALGMVCLLPHKEIEFDKNFKVLVDGKHCNSTLERQKILERYKTDAMAVSYDDIISLTKKELIDKLKDINLVYVYHNQIDARGDKLSTEKEVFTASEESFDEILRLIKKLTDSVNFSNHWITADHGFIYKRDNLSESDKVNLSNKHILIKNKRYLISNEALNIEGTSNYSLDYLNIKDVAVTTPKGVDIFKIKGAGQNYVHGGSSLQEIILPVLYVKSKKGSKNQNEVELHLISLSKKITNINTILTFAQKENISNRILPLEAKLYFEDEDGNKISNEAIIHANKKVDSAQDREFKEKFTLRNKKYSKSKKYYLVMKNMENDVEINRYEFIIDIAISDDFDF